MERKGGITSGIDGRTNAAGSAIERFHQGQRIAVDKIIGRYPGIAIEVEPVRSALQNGRKS